MHTSDSRRQQAFLQPLRQCGQRFYAACPIPAYPFRLPLSIAIPASLRIPAITLRIPYECPLNTLRALRVPFERPSNAYECPSNTPRMPYEYPSECLTNALRMPYECLTNALHNLSESPDRISHFFPELLWTRSPAFPGAVRPQCLILLPENSENLSTNVYECPSDTNTRQIRIRANLSRICQRNLLDISHRC